MARRKGAAVDAVQSKEEAARALGRYAELAGEVDAINAERAVKRAVLDKDADERIARREEDMKALFARLKPWWEVAGDAVTAGKRRSAELGGCQIGMRTTPPKLEFEGKEAGAIARLLKGRLKGFVRVRFSLEKPAIVAAINHGLPEGDPGFKVAATLAARLKRLAFWTAQKDEFFIEPLAPSADDTVAEEPAQ